MIPSARSAQPYIAAASSRDFHWFDKSVQFRGPPHGSQYCTLTAEGIHPRVHRITPAWMLPQVMFHSSQHLVEAVGRSIHGNHGSPYVQEHQPQSRNINNINMFTSTCHSFIDRANRRLFTPCGALLSDALGAHRHLEYV